MPGPYKLQVRKELLRKLLKAQASVREEGPDANAQLILPEELHEIRRIWRMEEQDWEDSLPKIYREEMCEDLDWVSDDTSGFSPVDEQLLCQVCEKHNVPERLVAKLMDLERDLQGMSRRAGVYKRIDRVFKEDWLDADEIAAVFAQNDTEEVKAEC